MIFRIVIDIFLPPVNPVDPVNIMRSQHKHQSHFFSCPPFLDFSFPCPSFSCFHIPADWRMAPFCKNPHNTKNVDGQDRQQLVNTDRQHRISGLAQPNPTQEFFPKTRRPRNHLSSRSHAHPGRGNASSSLERRVENDGILKEVMIKQIRFCTQNGEKINGASSGNLGV